MHAGTLNSHALDVVICSGKSITPLETTQTQAATPYQLTRDCFRQFWRHRNLRRKSRWLYEFKRLNARLNQVLAQTEN
jgi:hypothetical protein